MSAYQEARNTEAGRQFRIIANEIHTNTLHSQDPSVLMPNNIFRTVLRSTIGSNLSDQLDVIRRITYLDNLLQLSSLKIEAFQRVTSEGIHTDVGVHADGRVSVVQDSDDPTFYTRDISLDKVKIGRRRLFGLLGTEILVTVHDPANPGVQGAEQYRILMGPRRKKIMRISDNQGNFLVISDNEMARRNENTPVYTYRGMPF